jgi:hypothetical protein
MFVINYLTGAAGRQQPPYQPWPPPVAPVAAAAEKAAAVVAAVGPDTRFLKTQGQPFVVPLLIPVSLPERESNPRTVNASAITQHPQHPEDSQVKPPGK